MAFIIKQNDTRPLYVATLKENVGLQTESSVDLTDSDTVRFLMREQSKTDNDGPPKVDGNMTVVGDPTDGVLSYEWQPNDTNTVGEYSVEIEVTWNDGGVETFPNIGYGTVTITDDLG